MSFRVMMKKAIAVICVSIAALVALDRAGRNAAFAKPAPTPRRALDDTPWNVIALHEKFDGVDQVFKGFRTVCSKARLIPVDIHATNAFEVSLDFHNLVFAVGDRALFLAMRSNEERIMLNLKPFPIIYALVRMPPEKPPPYITGVDSGNMGTHLEIISKVFPDKRIGAIYSRLFPPRHILEAVKEANMTPEIEFNAMPLTESANGKHYFRTDFVNLTKHMDVFWEFFDPQIMKDKDLMYEYYWYAKKHGKPIVTFDKLLVGSGNMEARGLMAIYDDRNGVGKQSGQMANKVIAGTSPESIPREMAASCVITVNLFEAKYFKLTIPPEIAPEGCRIEYITPKKWSEKPK